MKLLIVSFLCIILFFNIGLAQEQTDQPTTNQNQPEVIDLTQLGKTYTISARMELPQVRMFEKRLNPDFKKLSAEKSYTLELSPAAEEIQYEPITSGKVQSIDNLDALLNKKRF